MHLRRTAAPLTVLALLVSVTLPLLTGTAQARAAAPPPPVTAAADALPTVQINGVVWKTAIVGDTVFAVGSFTRARPAGTPVGSPYEVPRSNILSFSLSTGALLPFAPVLNAQAWTVQASPDGKTVYVGGDFTTVDGMTRNRIVAFDVASGRRLTTFVPSLSATVKALAVTPTQVYVGGNFFTASGQSRTRLAAFSTSNGALLPWAPTADDGQVEALAVSPTDTTRVIVGGRFHSLDKTTVVGVGALGATTGLVRAWSSRPVPTPVTGMGTSWVTDLQVVGNTVYGSADGEGGHWFDGRFAASFSTGDLIWLDNCYGATYGLYVSGSVVYSVGHAHDCSSMSAFTESNPKTHHHTLAETTYAVGTDPAPPSYHSNYSHQPVPQLLPWLPTFTSGKYTGANQAAWAITGNGQYIVEAGEFLTVNGVAQQGLVRFAVRSTAPDKMGPVYSPALVPTATSSSPGTVAVTWPATWDPDDATLRYDLFRDTVATPLASVTQAASAWTTTFPTVPTSPAMSFTDTGLDPGSVHTYRLKVTDPSGNVIASRSQPVTVSARSPG